MSAIRVGLIGCGVQGEIHLQELAGIEGVELAAIADLDEGRLAKVGDRFGIPMRCTDARELLDEGLDLVSICTMPNTHRDFVVHAVEAGSHVLCEKPLALDAREGAEMVRAAERAERLLMVGFNMRYLGATAAIRRFMAEGLLGDLVCARGYMLASDVPWWGKHYVRALSGGGALNSSAVHMVDLLIWLAGGPKPLTASASMATLFPRKRAHNAPAGAAAAYDVEDLLFGHVRFEGGFWFSIEGSWTYDRSGWNYSFDAHGTRGQAHLDPLELYTERDGAPVRVFEDAPTQPDFETAVGPELRDVVESVRTGRVAERLATGRQALVVQAVVDALYRSAGEGREVAVEVPDV
ncbi:MAG TPA: Gfo/Idh/MocA family oxidoreductase [Conexibacter sp.]|nr:Gfo/Idh/MocA family oxidoreductase [Conexibacter sp.]